MSRLDLVVGPNGAGKSTFIEFLLVPLLPGSVLVNADAIAEQRWPGEGSAHAYEAARIAAQTRRELVRKGQAFIAETVFSHPSKLDLIDDAQAHQYRVFLHVLLVPEQIAVERVIRRVAAGGHSVAEEKIRQRYQRLWPLVADAASRCEGATFYDSTARPSPQIVARLHHGFADGATSWPAWTPTPLLSG